MFGLIVRFILNDEKAAAAFDALLEPVIERVLAEPKTLIYQVHRVEGRPLERVFYELYPDVAGFEEHDRKSYVQEFIATVNEQHASSMQIDRLERITGKGA